MPEKNYEKLEGIVQRVNPKGIRIDGRWLNYSKFIKDIPDLEVGNVVKLEFDRDFIMKVALLSYAAEPEKPPKANHRGDRDLERQIVITRLACLNTATEIIKSHSKPVQSEKLFEVAGELEEWVWEGLREV